MPDVEVLESHLSLLADVCSASEVVLFEKATLLVMLHYSSFGGSDLDESNDLRESTIVTLDNSDDSDQVLLSGLSASMLPDAQDDENHALSADRYERISELVKQLKISCLCVAFDIPDAATLKSKFRHSNCARRRFWPTWMRSRQTPIYL